MQRSLFVLMAALAGASAFAVPAAAEDYVTATSGGTRVWVGGGVQFLSLPDIRFVGKGSSPTDMRRQKNSESDWLDFGGSGGAGFETGLGWLGNSRVSLAVDGFYSNVETDDTTACRNQTCFVFDPAGLELLFGPPTLKTHTDREADYWGAQAEFKLATGAPKEVRPNVYRNDYWLAGFDVRGIDQDNKLRGRFNGRDIYSYKETLDTTYYGGYIGFGGEYSFGFIPIIGNALKGTGGIFERLGLRTYLNATAGLYNADTDYNGRFFSPLGGGFSSAISQSNDELAFIGTVSLETRKQIGTRTSLSLWTDYEYISSVPEMKYANTQHPTRIDDDSVFATRTMLRLNIGLGPDQLYPPPP